MQDLSVTLVQTALHWHDAAANREMLAQKLAGLTEATDLIVLPEMFTTGFSMEAPHLAEKPDGPTLAWLQEQAAIHKAVITGSLITEENGQYFNRLIWMRPDGSFTNYDKRHLFRMAGEHQVYTAGTARLIVTLNGWRICPLVCYDLRFPVWSRNIGPDYDLLLYVANWPAKRSLAWKTLLPARAIENLAYVAGVNRVGEDGKSIVYTGDSAAYGPTGEVIWQQSHAEAVETIKLSPEALQAYRQSFPAYLDADSFLLNN
ncbi:nitrilase family protein [Adhaeribacter aerolatus]|uniref:Omega-amidase YafV n=1 Tax=Adhaeribacter aerolatus TaxID=670289 RepID=A0A512AS86_9BACT|nr:amidohydrolase [Adhaeribacter aerolatus]GEO02573.1 nitrilase family protein [Adhaeribacter aerolatus]